VEINAKYLAFYFHIVNGSVSQEGTLPLVNCHSLRKKETLHLYFLCIPLNRGLFEKFGGVKFVLNGLIQANDDCVVAVTVDTPQPSFKICLGLEEETFDMHSFCTKDVYRGPTISHVY